MTRRYAACWFFAANCACAQQDMADPLTLDAVNDLPALPAGTDADAAVEISDAARDVSDAIDAVQPKEVPTADGEVDWVAVEVVDATSDVTTVSSVCGNGKCDGEESPANCWSDCGWLWNRYGAPCGKAASQDCGDGYFCVARGKAGGGAICVSDRRSWMPLPDQRTATDFIVDGATVVDKVTGLQWQSAAATYFWDWPGVSAACLDKTYNGLNDWRLPTLSELLSLVDLGKMDPALAAPIAWTYGYNDVWSAVPYAGDANEGWYVWFYTGRPYPAGPFAQGLGINTPKLALCVRSSAAVALPVPVSPTRFNVSADTATVFDHSTGLRWQRKFGGEQLTWSDANTFCEANKSGLPGKGWRLPTRDELLSIVDTQVAWPAINATIFPDTQTSDYWSSSAMAQGGDWHWAVAFCCGMAEPGTETNDVRCVR